MKRILLTSALTLSSLCIAGTASADSFWQRLNESSQIAVRYHLTEQHVENHKQQFPALLGFWKGLPEQLQKHIVSIVEDEDSGETLGEKFQKRYGFKLEELTEQLQGEIGATFSFEFASPSEDQESQAHYIVWGTPDKGTETLFQQIKTIWETELRESEHEEGLQFLEEVTLGGNRALYFYGAIPVNDWEVNAEDQYVEVVTYSGYSSILVATEQHIAIQGGKDLGQTFDTMEEALASQSFSPSDFSFLGRILYESPAGTFIRQFSNNPAYARPTEEAPVFEVAVNLVPFVNFMQILKEEATQEAQNDLDTPPALLKSLQIDWLKVSGLTLTENLYGSVYFSSEGMESNLGIEGTFGSPQEHNLMKLAFDKPANGLTLPTWIPEHVAGAFEGSLKLGQIYNLITDQLALHLGSEWTDMLNQANTVVKVSTGYELADHFHSLGEHFYSLGGEVIPVSTPVAVDSEEEDIAIPAVSQANIFEVSNAPALNGLLEQLALINSFSGGEPVLTRASIQGFNGWQMTHPNPADGTRWSFLHNGELLVTSNYDELTNTLLNLISNRSNTQSGFLQTPKAQELIRKQNLSRLSYLGVKNTAVDIKNAQSMFPHTEDGPSIGFLEQIVDDSEVVEFLGHFLGGIPWDELQKEMGYAISTGELQGRNGFLIRSLQTSLLTE